MPTFVPAVSVIFRTAPIPSDWWPIIMLCFLPSFIGIGTDKALRRFCGRPQLDTEDPRVADG